LHYRRPSISKPREDDIYTFERSQMRLACSTMVPAVLHTNHESRAEGQKYYET